MLRIVWFVKLPASAGHVEEVAPAIGLAAQLPTHAGKPCEWLACAVAARAMPGLTRAAAMTTAIAIRVRVILKRPKVKRRCSWSGDNGCSFDVGAASSAPYSVYGSGRTLMRRCCAGVQEWSRL